MKDTEKFLRTMGADTIDMAEAFLHGEPTVFRADESVVYMRHPSGAYMFWAKDGKAAESYLSELSAPPPICVVHGREVFEAFAKAFDLNVDRNFCKQYCLLSRKKFEIDKSFDIRMLTEKDVPFVQAHYELDNNPEHIRERINSGEMWGAYVDGCLAGFIGSHREGSIGMLEILPEYRRRGLATALEHFQMNRHIDMGFTPFGQVYLDNNGSHALQAKTGLDVSKDVIIWVAPKGEE